MAKSAIDPEVDKLIYVQDEREVLASTFLNAPREEVISLRSRLESQAVGGGQTDFVCAYCYSSVVIRSKSLAEDVWYFKHKTKSECRYSQFGGSSAAAIDAMRFNGKREGHRHRQLKSNIIASIKADPRFETPIAELRWIHHENRQYRQPDVTSSFAGKWLAFDGQISRTHLHVIAERRAFYSSVNGVLVWVFDEFDLSNDANEKQRPLTQDDLFIPNNYNAFVIDQCSVDASRQSGRFMLWCIYRDPWKPQAASLERKLIGFDEIKIDTTATPPTVYYFDYRSALAAYEADAPARKLRQLREDTAAFFCDPRKTFRGPQFDDLFERLAAQDLVKRSTKGCASKANDFQLIELLYSAKFGFSIRDRRSLIELLEDVSSNYPHWLRAFARALKVYNMKAEVVSHEHAKHWHPKGKALNARVKAGDPRYDLCVNNMELLKCLFPELDLDTVKRSMSTPRRTYPSITPVARPFNPPTSNA